MATGKADLLQRFNLRSDSQGWFDRAIGIIQGREGMDAEVVLGSICCPKGDRKGCPEHGRASVDTDELLRIHGISDDGERIRSLFGFTPTNQDRPPKAPL